MAVELLDAIFVQVGEVKNDIGHACVIQAEESIHLVMQQIWQEYFGRSKARAQVLRGLSAAMLGWLARAMEEGAPGNTNLSESNLVQRLKTLIEDYHLQQWRGADDTSALSITPTHLSIVTKAATVQSALLLIKARSMREERRHLAYTNLSIATIAYAMRYEDHAYFTRVFTQDAGISARAFRAQLSKQPQQETAKPISAKCRIALTAFGRAHDVALA